MTSINSLKVDDFCGILVKYPIDLQETIKMVKRKFMKYKEIIKALTDKKKHDPVVLNEINEYKNTRSYLKKLNYLSLEHYYDKDNSINLNPEDEKEKTIIAKKKDQRLLGEIQCILEEPENSHINEDCSGNGNSPKFIPVGNKILTNNQRITELNYLETENSNINPTSEFRLIRNSRDKNSNNNNENLESNNTETKSLCNVPINFNSIKYNKNIKLVTEDLVLNKAFNKQQKKTEERTPDQSLYNSPNKESKQTNLIFNSKDKNNFKEKTSNSFIETQEELNSLEKKVSKPIIKKNKQTNHNKHISIMGLDEPEATKKIDENDDNTKEKHVDSKSHELFKLKFFGGKNENNSHVDKSIQFIHEKEAINNDSNILNRKNTNDIKANTNNENIWNSISKFENKPNIVLKDESFHSNNQTIKNFEKKSEKDNNIISNEVYDTSRFNQSKFHTDSREISEKNESKIARGKKLSSLSKSSYRNNSSSYVSNPNKSNIHSINEEISEEEDENNIINSNESLKNSIHSIKENDDENQTKSESSKTKSLSMKKNRKVKIIKAKREKDKEAYKFYFKRFESIKKPPRKSKTTLTNYDDENKKQVLKNNLPEDKKQITSTEINNDKIKLKSGEKLKNRKKSDSVSSSSSKSSRKTLEAEENSDDLEIEKYRSNVIEIVKYFDEYINLVNTLNNTFNGLNETIKGVRNNHKEYFHKMIAIDERLTYIEDKQSKIEADLGLG
jgi:hypothetical protein